MDSKHGHCWRCAKKLSSQDTTQCQACGIAEYCSRRCKKDDAIRHGSVECQLWGPKTCGYCRKKGNLQECSGCHTVWYCNRVCQTSAWKTHKVSCSSWKSTIKEIAKIKHSQFSVGETFRYASEWPFYFGNTIAVDLLNLAANELGPKGTFDLKSDLRLLLAASGDIRHLVSTVSCLPQEYGGKLHFTINDCDPFVMARNVMLLFMMFSGKDALNQERDENVATIWMSMRLPTKCFMYLRETLLYLSETDDIGLNERFSGLLTINEEDFECIRQVWNGWLKLSDTCLNLDRQRKTMFNKSPKAEVGMSAYINSLPLEQQPFIKHFFENGVVLASGEKERNPLFYNVTLTGRPHRDDGAARHTPPELWDFVYCVRSDCIPFQLWDSCKAMDHFHDKDFIGVCHSYVQKLSAICRRMFSESRLSVEVLTKDFKYLKYILESYQYDRIETSNIADYYGHEWLIDSLGPLLSKTNPFAVLLTKWQNWQMYVMHQGALNVDVGLERKLCKIASADTKQFNQFENRFKGDTFYIEYLNNVAHFVNYLRGEKSASSCSEQTTHGPKIKTFEEVKHYSGFCMRNFRKERNKVVPFCFRVNVRKINMLRGFERNIEWFRVETGAK